PRAIRSTQHNGPPLLSFVIRATLEFGGGPEVELHALHISLEPAGKFVFGNVGRPARWKRHVRKMVDVHLVVQGQCMISLAPGVTDALFAVYDQCIHLQLSKVCRDRKSGLPAANNQYSWISIGILGGRLPKV